MPVDVNVEVTIARPRSVVAAYMFDPFNDAAWTTGVIEARPLAAGRLQTGSRVHRRTKFLGKTFEYEYRVVAADDDRSVELEVDEPFPMHIRYELEDVTEGTVARIRASGDASGFFRLAAPLMAGMVRRNIAKDLANLKSQVESLRA